MGAVGGSASSPCIRSQYCSDRKYKYGQTPHCSPKTSYPCHVRDQCIFPGSPTGVRTHNNGMLLMHSFDKFQYELIVVDFSLNYHLLCAVGFTLKGVSSWA